MFNHITIPHFNKIKKVHMTNRLLIQIIALFVVIPCFAQFNPEAKDILDKAAKVVKTSSGVEATFEITLENKKEEIEETSKGTVWIKDDKFKLTIMGFESYFDGVTMWTHMVDEGEVNISTPDPAENEGLTPTGIFNLYEKGFQFKIVEEGTTDGKNMVSIDMFPKERDKPYFKINVVINKTDNQFVLVKSFGKDGVNNTISITSFIADKDFTDEMFKFDASKHPDVEVIDMR